jgi:hypothetical protein
MSLQSANKVVYRGYGAPERLQQMHDQAIEARTRLHLERATEQRAQDLESFKLESPRPPIEVWRNGQREGRRGRNESLAAPERFDFALKPFVLIHELSSRLFCGQ